MKRIPLILAALSLAPVVAMFATETNTSSVERRFQAIVVSADPARQTVRVRHKPTGFEAEVIWDEKSVVKVTEYFDMDDVPEGWVLCGFRDVDPERKEVCRLNRLEPLPGSKAPEKADEIKAQSGVRCKLVRVPVTPEILKGHNRLLTQDQKRAYALGVNGELWAVLRTLRRKMDREVAGSAADFAPGMGCRELVYREEAGVNRLVSAVLEPAFAAEIQMPAYPSGCTGEALKKGMDAFREKQREAVKQLRQRMPVRLHVVPELAGENEPVALEIEAWAQKSPNPEVNLDVSYLQPAAQQRKLSLVWKAGETADGLTKYTASLALPKLPVGQHCVSWTCDIGGDIPVFYRSFAVAGPGTLVAAVHICNGVLPTGIAANHLPHDRWQHHAGSTLTKFVAGQNISAQTLLSWTDASKLYRQEGIEPVFVIGSASYTGMRLNDLPVSLMFSAEPEDLQQAVMAAVLEIGEVLGFSRDRASIHGYEVGAGTVRAARKAGVGAFAAFCAYQNWADGAWLINHSARPLQPYFASDEDFRKPAPRSKNAVVMINQLNTHALTFLEHQLGAFDTCLLDDAATGPFAGGRAGRLEVDEIYLSRMLDAVEAELQVQTCRKAPWFLDFGIQDFKTPARPVETTRANVVLFDYLLRRVREGANIVFCGQRGQIDYYQRYKEIPETVDYEPNWQCGSKAYGSVKFGGMAVDYPDVMEIENARYTAWFKKSEGMLPAYHWDDTKPWNYPDWGNTQLPRYAGSRNLRYDTDDKYAITPLTTDTRKLKVSRTIHENAGELDLVVTLDTPEAIKSLPLALWDIPREWKGDAGWWRTANVIRFVPIRAPYTGNLNGILEVDAQPGKNEYRLTITTPKRAPQSQDILLKTVHAKVFTRDGQTMAYVWPTRPWETAFDLEVPVGRPVQYYAAPKGERVDLPPGSHRLVIAQESWSRIVGLSYEELLRSLRSVDDAEKQDQPPPSDKRLLKNIDTLKPAVPSAKPLPAIDKLETELATLWDWEQQGKRPLDPEVVFSTVKNGYRTEGIYINGYGDADGQDRVFFYYSRPESGDKKGPLYIDLTGGGEADRSAWIARTYQCAVIDIEWRAFKNKFSSKWAAGKLGSMKEVTSLKNNMVFRLISGIRRAIDFAAQQPGTDMERLGCGGGSMGGYYTLLAAGVDQRIRFGMDELGAGYLGQTDSSLGQFELPPEYKTLWLKAFDPYSYAGRTHARILMNLAANDYFFWLADGIKNFQGLAGEKTLCISPNFNHPDGCYGATKHNPMDWLPYALGHETAYPAIASATQDGATYRVATQPGVTIQNATLYWSLGRDIVWPARYWLAVPAVFQNGVWQAEVPSRFAALERWAFMNVRSDKGRTASSLPTFTAGVNPQEAAGG